MSINTRKFGRFLDVVHRSGIHETIEARLRPEGVGGAPRALKTDVFLAAMMATVDDNRSQTLKNVHATLTVELDIHLQERLGVRANGQPIAKHRVYYLMSAIKKAYAHTDATAPETLDKFAREERRDSLQDLVDKLLAATTKHLEPASRYAVDATSIESWGKGKRRSSKKSKSSKDDQELPRYSVDPDAAWGYRTATYGHRSNIFFGYHLTSVVRVGAVNAAPYSQPLMTERILLSPANLDDVPDAVVALDRLMEQVGPVLELMADRGYSNKVPESWARPLRVRGIEQVIDMMPSDHGARPDAQHGYIMLDGWPHDPSVPEHLHVIEKPGIMTVASLRKGATREEKADRDRRLTARAEFNALIAERQLYAYTRHSKGKNGAVRYKCPGAAGKLKTAGCQHSVGLPDGLPTSAHPVGIPVPTACQEGHETFQIGAQVQEKLRQRYYWGSPAWQRAFARRTAVEQTFGYLKSTSTLNTTRGWTQQVGLVKTFILLAVRIAVMNIRNLARWAVRTGNTADPLTTVDLADYGHQELDPQGNVAGGISPPPAA